MSRTVLIVDDFDDSRLMMRILFEHHGCEVFEASDGHDAIEMMATHPPGLILMDLAMPGMSGIEATMHIREKPEYAKLPIIALTAHGDLYDQKALAAGCDRVIAKPVTFEILESLITEYLS